MNFRYALRDRQQTVHQLAKCDPLQDFQYNGDDTETLAITWHAKHDI